MVHRTVMPLVLTLCLVGLGGLLFGCGGLINPTHYGALPDCQSDEMPVDVDGKGALCSAQCQKDGGWSRDCPSDKPAGVSAGPPRCLISYEIDKSKYCALACVQDSDCKSDANSDAFCYVTYPGSGICLYPAVQAEVLFPSLSSEMQENDTIGAHGVTASEKRGAPPTPQPTFYYGRVQPNEKFNIIACADIDSPEGDARLLSIHSSGFYGAAWFTPSEAYKHYVTEFHVTGCSSDEYCVNYDKVLLYAGSDLIVYPGNAKGAHNASNWPWMIFGDKPDTVKNWKSDSKPPFGAPIENLGGPMWYLQPIDGISNLIVYEQKIFIQNVAENWPDVASGDKHPLDGKKIFVSNITEDTYLDTSIMSEYCDNLEQNCAAIVRDEPQCVIFRKIE